MSCRGSITRQEGTSHGSFMHLLQIFNFTGKRHQRQGQVPSSHTGRTHFTPKKQPSSPTCSAEKLLKASVIWDAISWKVIYITIPSHFLLYLCSWLILFLLRKASRCAGQSHYILKGRLSPGSLYPKQSFTVWGLVSLILKILHNIHIICVSYVKYNGTMELALGAGASAPTGSCLPTSKETRFPVRLSHSASGPPLPLAQPCCSHHALGLLTCPSP